MTPPATPPVPRRPVVVAVVVLAAAWAVAVAVHGDGSVLWISLASGVAVGGTGAALLVRHGASVRAGHDVWLAVPAAAAHLAASYVAIPVAERIVPLIGRQAEGLVLDARGGLPTVVVALLAGAVIAPLEEVFWRGTVQPTLGAGRPWWQAAAITTAVFAGFHVPTLQLPLISAALLGGLVWGWLRERTDGIAAPAIAHAIWTAAMVLVPPT